MASDDQQKGFVVVLRLANAESDISKKFGAIAGIDLLPGRSTTLAPQACVATGVRAIGYGKRNSHYEKRWYKSQVLTLFLHL